MATLRVLQHHRTNATGAFRAFDALQGAATRCHLSCMREALPHKQTATAQVCSIANNVPKRQPSRRVRHIHTRDRIPNDVLHVQLRRATAILDSPGVPKEQDVQGALQICEGLARSLVDQHKPSYESDGGSATTELLSLDQRARKRPAPPRSGADAPQNGTAESISGVAYRIVQDPKIFLTPKSLATYVHIQVLLNRPKSLPDIFDLYANKPIPRAGTSPVIFKNPDASALTAAIPLDLAQRALTSAIEAKDLPLCYDIIDTTVCSPAFKRSKFAKKALLPLTALALSPLVAHSIASSLSLLQDTVDAQTLTNMGTVGIVAYIGFTAIIGVVAVTTANDQMERITWYQGTPLRERWAREEERAFADQVAQAWGLQNPESRGDEEGEEWQGLRRWVMARGMILDKPELMEGME